VREGAEVSLKNLFLWYTYPNISSKYNNNKLYYIKNNALIEKEIPEGMYDIPKLNKFLLAHCNGDISLMVDSATFKC